MDTPLLNERDVSFLLYEFLQTETLLTRERYRDHSREVFDAVLATGRTLAEKHFGNHYRQADATPPTFDGRQVTTLPEIGAAYTAVADAGFLRAHLDSDEGGLQLPVVVTRAALAYMSAANLPTASMHELTISATAIVRRCCTPTQRALFLPPLCDGRFSATMALTEPAQGSSLADLRTAALARPDGTYRLFGQKTFITAGDHELTGNILHFVLARLKDAPPGIRGLSLFLCPKYLVNDDGTLGQRNDVAVAGIIHKMGYQGSVNAVLNFGEHDGAVAYLVGEPHRGLACMFEMMKEARIWVGINAAAVACRGFRYSLAYARERPQGRLPSSKDPLAPQVGLLAHADVRRMLLAQKAYAEGALALSLYACSLMEDGETATEPARRQQAGELLEVLIPVVKSWPARYGTQANDLAIQVLGGAGYTREYPVEQLYRDNRLNIIVEGAEGIHGLDLLGRQVHQPGYTHFRQAVLETLHRAEVHAATREFMHPLAEALRSLDEVTRTLRQASADDPDRGLANATLYLDFFGRITLAWIWLGQGMAAARALEAGARSDSDADFYAGKLQAMRYFFRWELPQTWTQAELLLRVDSTCFEMQESWF